MQFVLVISLARLTKKLVENWTVQTYLLFLEVVLHLNVSMILQIFPHEKNIKKDTEWLSDFLGNGL